MMGHSAIILALALAASQLSGCGSAGQQSASKHSGQGPDGPAIGGPFRLLDQEGRVVTDRDLLGKPSLVFFGFTYCPVVCPTTLQRMTKWLKDLGPDGDKISIFYVTVDPQRDTSAHLKEYLSSFDPRIRGLTGSADAVANIAREYHAFYKRVPMDNGDYVMEHTTMTYMMNAQGRFVAPIGYGEPDAQVLPLLRDLIAGRPPLSRSTTVSGLNPDLEAP